MKAFERYRPLHVLGLLGLALVLAVGPVGATHVTPTVVPGNPDCQDLGYDFGFKPQPEPPPSGTYFFGDPVTSPAHTPTGDSVTITSDGTFFDWASTLGIDAVIVKGGPNANVYVYDPPMEAFSDTGLHTPINPNNNQPFEISHIVFCYDFELDVEKTAETTFTRTFEWEIDKSVTPDTWDLFTGDSGNSEYTVTVTKSEGTDSDWAVSGTITIENNTPLNATVQSVTDSISGFGAVEANCGVEFAHVLAAGDTLECSYSTALLDGDNRTNAATVMTSGAVAGGEAEADVIFGEPTTVVNDSINVDDSFAGNLGPFSDSGSVTYERTFTCDGDEGEHDNTATIVETGQSADALVEVNCHALEVTKDAATSFTRTWRWTIDKSADQTDLLLAESQLFTVNYTVEVDASATDSEWAVGGNISVLNPAPIDATINAIADVVSPDIAAAVDCGMIVTFPHTLPGGETLECSYSADLPDAEDRTNTATATLQNFDNDSEGVGTPSGTTDFSGPANVVFSGTPDEEIDECVDVFDTNAVTDANPDGFLGTECAGDAPQTFNYSLDFGAHPDADVLLECGENTHTNIASFVTNHTGATDEDDWTVNARVECEVGCTLTPGYWKTHSFYGPAPFDDTWDLILPDGQDTGFFLSGQTYYEVLWTAPSGGNAYYILAHAYIAAELNQLNGASIPADVLDAFNDATELFELKNPADIAGLKGNSALRRQFITLAGILDEYNNGITGPGHCSE